MINLVFLDFETDGLDGPIVETCLRGADNEVLFENTDITSIIKFCKKEGLTIVVWHQFMIEYLYSKNKEAYKYLEGRFIIMTQIYSLFDGFKKSRYSIFEITKRFTNREHLGNALNDSSDLNECFYKMTKELLNNNV